MSSTPRSHLPVLLGSGKATVFICLCKPSNLGFILDTPFFLHNYSPNPLYFTCQISSTVCLLFSVSTPSYHGLLLGYESPNWSPSSRHASLPSSKFLCYLLLPILELSLNLSFCPHTHKSLSIMKCCI